MTRNFSSNFLFPSVEQSIPNIINESVKCNTIHYRNETLFLSIKYGFIPENTLINVCAWIVLLLLFSLLRKKAWNYGRMALVQKSEQRWTQVFYGESLSNSQLLNEETDSVDSLDMNFSFDKGFFSWIRIMFQLKDEHIRRKCGVDAVQYLSFQRHIIIFMSIVCVICLTVVLPVNFQGDLEGNSRTFGHTTLNNLNPESKLLWIHVVLSFLFLPLCIFFLRHFSLTLKLDEKCMVTRTLMVDGIPKDYCSRDSLIQHFQEAYPECIVQDIQFAFDISKLSKLDKKREAAMQARIWCETILKETGTRIQIRPYKCGRLCGCGCCNEVDGIDFYAEEEHSLSLAVDREKSIALLKPLGIAFVTFQNETMTELVYKDHQKRCKCNNNPPSSSLSRVLNPHDWEVTIAAAPEDICWDNLTQHKGKWYFRAFLVNCSLLVILFFFTTPFIIVNYFNLVRITKELIDFNPFLSELAPTFLLWLFSVILPILVAYTDQFLFHWTRSSYNHSVMMKTYLLLLFMVLILPSLGLTSIRYLLEITVKSKGKAFRWNCIFLPDGGAIFVNYVITSAFIGTVMELLRFSELFMLVCYLCFSRSRAEQASVRKAVVWEFEFGMQYAWFLLVFAVVITYSLACPLIVPFGLVYMVFKHCVDRYNIYFAYAPSKINQNIHETAINFVVISLFLLQIFLFSFSLVRIGWSYITVVTLGIFLLTLMVFFAQVSHNWFRQLSPITYRLIKKVEVTENGFEQMSNSSSFPEDKPFTPAVLKRRSSRDLFTTNAQNQTYGTNEESVTATPEKEVTSVTFRGSDVPYQRY